MDTCNITHFKNHVLSILSDVAESGRELVVTRHGKPLARVQPACIPKKIELGRLKGTMKVEGDIVAPLGDEDWNACQ